MVTLPYRLGNARSLVAAGTVVDHKSAVVEDIVYIVVVVVVAVVVHIVDTEQAAVHTADIERVARTLFVPSGPQCQLGSHSRHRNVRRVHFVVRNWYKSCWRVLSLVLGSRQSVH